MKALLEMTVWLTTALLFLLGLLMLQDAWGASDSTRTGYDLLRLCDGKPDAPETRGERIGQLTCKAYLHGFLDSYLLMSEWWKPHRQFICLPAQGVQAGQVLHVLLKWLKDHPGELHHMSSLVVFLALKETFPCP
jgi:hypothetical protein